MESKTKHRILGILVVIGLVIILLPLFQGKSELSSEATLIKAPPFPDQTVQVSAAQPDQSPSTPYQQMSPVAQTTSTTEPADNSVNQDHNDMLSTIHPSVVNAQVPETTLRHLSSEAPSHQLEAKTASTNTYDSTDSDNKLTELAPASGPNTNNVEAQATHETITPESRKTTIKTINDFPMVDTQPQSSNSKKTVKMASAASQSKIITPRIAKRDTMTKLPLLSSKASIDNNGLMRLKNAAWVIQIGSFKNKANALRLVNQLRANGYRAFIQQVSNNLGDSTRVFVGPENKQTSARALASQLESDMHIRGIVISYKPLTL